VLAAFLRVSMADAAVPPPTAPKLASNIPGQPLSTALAAFADQTGLQLGYDSGLVQALQSKGARAGQSPSRALSHLLGGTGLRFEFLNPRTVRIYAPPAGGNEPAKPASPNPEELSQVIVTGPRAQPLEKLPSSVLAYTKVDMQAAGIKGMAEVGAMTPGVEFDYFSSVGGGVYTNTALRGVTDRHGPATGIFIDGVPVPPTRSNTFARAFPSYFDLDRIEIWRGPQGALMGANTQGGAIAFVPSQPSLGSFSGNAIAEWSTTARGEPSYETGIAAGGPLVTDRVGYRLSAWYRADGGYVDRIDPFTSAVVDPDSNGSTIKSGRGALTFAPSEAVSVTGSVSYQSTRVNDSSAFFTYLSDPQQGRLENGSLVRQPFDDDFYVASLKVEASLGFAQLSAIGGYFHQRGSTTIDDTESVKWGGWGNPLGAAYPASYSNAITTYADLAQHALSQEVRLRSVDADARLTWVVGAYFAKTHSQETDRVVAEFIPLPQIEGPLDSSNTTTTVQTQLAGFGQLAMKITRHLTATAEMRVEHEEYSSSSVATPIFYAQAADTLDAPRYTLAYESGASGLVYFSVAKGYAPAGVDAAMPTCFLNPTPYPADTVWSYELGMKRDLMGERAQLDASAFHMSWNNGPALTGNCLFTHSPGAAVSNGFDLALRALLPGGLRTDLGISYTDAHYTQTVEENGQIIVHAGDAVGTPPLVTSPWNLTFSIERRVPLKDGLSVGLRAQDIVHTRNPGPFYTSDPASVRYAPGLLPDPATNLLNVRADLERDGFDVALFCNNVLDSQPTLLRRNKGDDSSTLFYATTFRPRTVGVSASWKF